MEESIFERNKLLYGEDYLSQIQEKHIFVFGLGGVGSFAIESLARSGFQNFTLIDFDIVSPSNINRQLIALNSTLGQKKIDLCEKRLLDINKNIAITKFDCFFSKDSINKVFYTKADFVVDAIDTMNSKILLLKYCVENNIPIVSSLGAGNRKDPSQLKIVKIEDIEKPVGNFAKNVLYYLKRENIQKNITFVMSKEIPVKIHPKKILNKNTKLPVASNPFVPAVCGYYMAFHILNSFLCGSRRT